MPSAQDSHCKSYASVQIMQELTELWVWLLWGRARILHSVLPFEVFCLKAFSFAIHLPYINIPWRIYNLSSLWRLVVVRLCINRRVVLTNTDPVLHLLLFFLDAGCLLSVLPDLPAIIRLIILFTLRFMDFNVLTFELSGVWHRTAPASGSWLLQGFSIPLFNLFKFIQLCRSERTKNPAVVRGLASLLNQWMLGTAYTFVTFHVVVATVQK